MMTILAALTAALAATQAAPATAPDVQGIEVTAGARIAGDMKTGVLAYPPSFFTVTRPSTALDMIAWLPGFVFEDTRDMRGLEGSTGNVLIDGKPPTSKTDTLQSVLRRIPADQVERVDIIVGGAPGINMRGRNIIANVVLKAGTQPKRTVMASTYVDGHGRVSPQLIMTTSEKRDDRALDASLDLSRTIGIYPGFGYGPTTRRDGSGGLIYIADTRVQPTGRGAVGNGSYELPLAGGRFRISGLGKYYDTVFDERYRLSPGPGGYSFWHQDTYRQGELGLRYERTFGRLGLETQLLERLTAFDGEDDNRRPPAFSTFSVHAAQAESILRAVLRFKKDETFTVEGFAEGALNTSDNQSAGTLDGLPRVIPAADVDVAERRGETGAALIWKPSPAFSLDAAMNIETSTLTARRDLDLTRRFTYLKPKLAVSWSPDKKTQLRLRVEHEVGQVQFTQYLTFAENNTNQLRVGNPGLRPQRAWIGEATVQRSFWTGGDLTLTLRRKALRDVFDVAPVRTDDGLFGVASNIGDGRETDVVANLTLPLKSLGLNGVTAKGAVTWRRQRVADPVNGLPRQLTNQPRTLAEFHLAHDLPRWRVNWGVDAFYRGASTFYRPFGNEEMAAWPHVNVFVEYRVSPALNLRIEAQNLPGLHTRTRVSVFDGLRDRSPLLYIDEKRLSVGPLLYVRLRRSFD